MRNTVLPPWTKVKPILPSGRFLSYIRHLHALTQRSYGSLFMDALHHAPYCGSIGPWVYDYVDYRDEDLTDEMFNSRLPGLNLDYMSWAMFTLVQRNPRALLDHMTLQTAAKNVFSTLFQHYASNNVTLTDGGSVFQSIGATLPFGLPPIVNIPIIIKPHIIDPDPHIIMNPPIINNTSIKNNTTTTTIINNTRPFTTLPIINTARGSDSSNGIPAPSYKDVEVRTSTNKSVEAIVHTPVNELVMSPTAVFLCLAITAFLACVAVLVYLPYAAYFKGLPRDVETLASTIAFVYDSPKLQEWVAANEHSLNPGEPATRRRGTSNSEGGDNSNLEADGDRAADRGLDEVTMGLGFFRGKQGVARWGVELERVVHANPKRPSTTLVVGEDE